MGIFDFFKKEKKTEKIAPEEIPFSEIQNWLGKKKEKNEIKEKEILVAIKNKIKRFDTDLRIKIIILEGVDVESKKVENRIKKVVINSRMQYIETAHNLMSSLENLKETKFADAVRKIDKIFFDFNKISFKNYERATILIGKEMADIKNEFKLFSKDLIETFHNNKKISELFQKIEFIESKLNLLDSVEKNIVKISEEVMSFNERINQKEKEHQRLLEEIKKIKQGDNHKYMLEKKEKLNTLKKEISDDIFALKQLINFKALANFFHINEKQMSVLKDCKEDFHVNFEKDYGKKIVELLNESKLNTDAISEKINLIKTKNEELLNYKEDVAKDETQKLYYKIKEAVTEVDNLKIEKVKEEKRNERFKANKEELVNSIKQEFGKMNVEVV